MSAKRTDLDMTTGNPMSIIFKFTMTLLIGNIAQQLYNIVDTIIVGRFVNPLALAAVGSTGNIMFLMIGTSNFAKTLEFLYYVRKHGYDEAIYFDTFPIREQGIREAECNVAMVNQLEQIIDKLGMDNIEEVVAANDGIAVSKLLLDAIR